MKILNVKNLNVTFAQTREAGKSVHAVRNVGFDLEAAQCLAVVGESGCGKSAMLRSLMGLDTKNCQIRGQLCFKNEDITVMNEQSWRQYRGKKIAMIFQDPMTALNPTMTIGQQIEEALPKDSFKSKRARKKRVLELLIEVRITDAELRVRQYPFELSGGMLQRIAIAIALAGEPELILADEPTTALDVSVQKQILNLLKTLQKKRGMSLILVTHDLAVVAEVADRVLVMYAGEIIESTNVESLIREPQHPYTKALLASVPKIDAFANSETLFSISGQAPDLSREINYCAFCERCSEAMNICARQKPPAFELVDGEVYCWKFYKA